MIQVFEIMKQIDCLPINQLFTLSDESGALGHSFKHAKRNSRILQRASTFSQRVVNPWKFTFFMRESDSINNFKSALNAAWKDHPLKFDV